MAINRSDVKDTDMELVIDNIVGQFVLSVRHNGCRPHYSLP